MPDSADTHLDPKRAAVPRIRLRVAIAILSVLFIATGCTALLVEQIFEKVLSTLLGSTTQAAATVLGVYFSGLSLGAVGYSRWIKRRFQNPLTVFACLEGAIAVYSCLLYLAFSILVPIFAPVLSLGVNHFLLLQLLRILVAGFWVLPPTFLMGATFPAIVDSLQWMRVPNRTRAIALFYSLNLLGAVVGSIAGPYLIFPRWGLDRTLLLCFGLDALVGAAGIFLAREWQKRRTMLSAQSPVASTTREKGVAVVVLVAALSGFLFFALEVTWTHLIGAVLGNSIYAFAVMLGSVLAGLCAGALLAGKMVSKKKYASASLPGYLLLAAGLILSISQARWPEVPHSLRIWGGGLETFAQGEVLRWIQALILLFPTSFVLGIVFPLLFRLEFFPAHSRERVAGLMVASNSLASVVGALVTGFILIPTLGSYVTLLCISLLYSTAGLVLSVRLRPSGKRASSLVFAGIVFLVIGLQRPWDLLKLTSGEHVYFQIHRVNPATKLIFFREETAGGITTVVQNPVPGQQGKTSLTLLTNGKFQGNDSGERTAEIGFALIPILHNSAFDDALVIGLGTGQSADVVRIMGFNNIDVAEISPGIVEAARDYFGHINGKIFSWPAVHLHLQDGRNFLLLQSKQYDLITIELSSVWFAGSTNLYSREFYSVAKAHLKPGGMFQQWVQLHHIGIREIAVAIATMKNVFPYVSFWDYGDQGILVGSETPQTLNSSSLIRFETHFSELGVDGDFNSFIRSVLASRLLAPEDLKESIFSGVPLNTDRNRLFEYITPRYYLDRRPLADMNRAVLRKLSQKRGFILNGPESSRFQQLVGEFNSQAPR